MEERRESRSVNPSPALLNLPGAASNSQNSNGRNGGADVGEINIFSEQTDRYMVTASNTEIIEKESVGEVLDGMQTLERPNYCLPVACCCFGCLACFAAIAMAVIFFAQDGQVPFF